MPKQEKKSHILSLQDGLKKASDCPTAAKKCNLDTVGFPSRASLLEII